MTSLSHLFKGPVDNRLFQIAKTLINAGIKEFIPFPFKADSFTIGTSLTWGNDLSIRDVRILMSFFGSFTKSHLLTAIISQRPSSVM